MKQKPLIPLIGLFFSPYCWRHQFGSIWSPILSVISVETYKKHSLFCEKQPEKLVGASSPTEVLIKRL